MRWLIGLTTAIALTSIASAADAVFQTATPLQKPRKEAPRGGGPLDRVEAAIWIPEGVPILRGAIVNPFYLKTVEQKHWQEAARLWGFAVVGANYFGTNEYATLLPAMKDFAKQSSHPELEHVPFCFVGMSAGAGMSVRFAELMPERTIAVGPVCLEVGPRSPESRKVPMITVFGEKDGKQMMILGEKLPAERKEAALWATAVQWGRGHEFAYANNLVLPVFDSVIRRRLPKVENGLVKLLDIPEADGWLADPATWASRWPTVAKFDQYAGDKTQAGWLPDARTAAIWRAFVAKAPSVKITAPPGLGDGQPFVLHEADAPIAVMVDAGKAAKVELFNGDVRLGESADGKFSIQLPAGIHTLIAVVSEPEKSASRPHTIMVRKK